jgi:ABC-type phosphate/phosphonate transport system ATPase subunit
MKIQALEIKNFRGLSDVRFAFEKHTNVIVGPNAIGKTTVLESIRLVRALLMPRYFQETQQVLIGLGLISPQYQFVQNALDFASVARDSGAPLTVSLTLQLSAPEVDFLTSNAEQIAMEQLRGRLGRADDQLALTQLLSSPQGKAMLANITEEATKRLSASGSLNQFTIALVIDPLKGGISGSDSFLQNCVQILERALPPHRALFSYFPADRAFPSGEVAIQIGSNEAAAQIQSHIGQAVTKYQRLKQTVVNAMFGGAGPDTSAIKDDFELVLKALLPGKQLAGVALTPTGNLRVAITELATGKTFDIDSMSSGEKGLILTFLLIRRTMANGGIVLIDEPELHLNPEVCKKIVSFLNDVIATPADLQVILCTHSAEILGTAFERRDCGVFHLRSHRDATKLYERDQRELFDALKRLGSSAADSIFSRGGLFVEGEHDSVILEEGFFGLVSGFKITDLGGRTEVEKEIRTLQAAEQKGDLSKIHCFIFDLDHKPTGLRSSPLVRVLQWDRTCLENFLLGEKALFDTLSEVGAQPLPSRGEFETLVRELAIGQLTELVAKQTYASMEPDNPGLRPKEIAGLGYDAIADALVSRLLAIRAELSGLDVSAWKRKFVEEANTRERSLKDQWATSWRKLCDGKRLIDDLYKRLGIRIGKLDFKIKVVRHMAAEASDDWQLIKGKLHEAIAES